MNPSTGTRSRPRLLLLAGVAYTLLAIGAFLTVLVLSRASGAGSLPSGWLGPLPLAEVLELAAATMPSPTVLAGAWAGVAALLLSAGVLGDR